MFVNLNVFVTTPSGAPVVGATVLIGRDYGNGTQRTTDGGGFANFGVEQDNLDWEVALDGYTPVLGNAPIGFDDVNLPVTLTPISSGGGGTGGGGTGGGDTTSPPPQYANLNITVTAAATAAPLAGATVLISPDFGNGTQRTTDGNGFANFGVLVGADVEINILKAGFVNNDHTIHIDDASDHAYAIALVRSGAGGGGGGGGGEIIIHPGFIDDLTPILPNVPVDVAITGFTPATFETRDGVPSFTAQSFGALDIPGLGLTPGSIFATIIGGLIGLFHGSSGEATVTRLAGVVQNMGQFLLQLATTVADVSTRSVHAETQGGHLFDRILGGVLGPIINALASVIRGGAADLGKLFGPLTDSIKKLVNVARHIYDKWLRPILHAIDVARQILRVLESFHLKWAAEADAALGRLEGKLSAPLLLAIRKLNEVSGVVNRIVTFDGALQRVTLLKSMVKHAPCVNNVWWNSQASKPGQYAKQSLDQAPPMLSADEFGDAIGSAVYDNAGPFAAEANRLDALISELSA